MAKIPANVTQHLGHDLQATACLSNLKHTSPVKKSKHGRKKTCF